VRITLNNNYWNQRYQTNQTGWDIGYPSPSFLEYFKNINRNSKLLIPGCGNSYEGEALHQLGFNNITLLDFAETSKENFIKRYPTFPSEQFIVGDFFELQDQYDYVLEQTFFCALPPDKRKDYMAKMKELILPTGKLVGLLFDATLNSEHPPFGGSKKEYESLFRQYFNNINMSTCKNSINPRQGKELWIEVSHS
jgi:thiopurine S-methyltransferase